MYAFPYLVAGEGRACTELMLAAKSLTVLKTGAEGVYVAIIPDRNLGVALKICDGSSLASEAAISTILIRLGILDQNHPLVSKRVFVSLKNWNGIITGAIKTSDAFWFSGNYINS